MSEIKAVITQQLQQLQTLMHRMAFYGFTVGGKTVRNPYRGQGRVLAILRVKPEISQKELTELLGTSKQSLAEVLAKLEKNGYIEREPSENNKRSSVVRLLDAGRKALEDMDGNTMEVSQIFDCLSAEELAQFSACLSRVIKRCVEHFPGENLEESSRRMESFLARYDHSFTHFDEHGAPPEQGRDRDEDDSDV